MNAHRDIVIQTSYMGLFKYTLILSIPDFDQHVFQNTFFRLVFFSSSNSGKIIVYMDFTATCPSKRVIYFKY